ncbi:undecaprenyldiphospho-muramoylpentapeptide beta-N-acetylglucosaminyltransferase [Blochmannia endosymbiont of Camponotus sp.]|uniref:undecaprenyldiphospho-muramoylpentapeptide beta-N-acetylglucosaminyltransferase n=1 Tax=Blochmannia endosymbiont of Camponotus sp. TaxID=700220 RepID=UPI002023DE76|nr:undecaprenyldiphospho-muramoylpentapeptide beta-N-acetylglucosaminyltransferase [Blochmannia endosymbiont of Camponotus sp.]URJ30218.1 undecaprenyldiphospho-muramoylpentapeptide beta-N-acetylglucosaminyltransferase [Blochmannia endosymbiont of Camponotus sp.]URJ31435.1 undecaprenyldiphospho-muramoylpentapeptide beta-N-acetylglucosaminyltransferase [Blochmannia endosymbiont of Camponotus sp.]
MNQKKRILIVAGGSGGHVFPGLSVAHYLIDNGYQVVWLGTADRIEAKLVPKYGIDIKFIHIKRWHGEKLYIKCIMPLYICLAVYQARKIIKYWKPDIVLGMGGYVSGPSGLAAWTCGIPLIIHEQNRIIGLTNRYLSMFAAKVLQGFPNTFPNAKIVGNPIRRTILAIPNPVKRWQGRVGPIRVLVIGGSQGAHILNKIIPNMAEKLSNKLIIWHQVGEQDFKKVKWAYQKIKQSCHKIVKFIDDIAQAYSWADILISRAGALTVSEVSVVGLPAIFVPFIHHKDRQQYWNAMSLVQVGAAKIIEQQNFTSDYVSTVLESWDRKTLCSMAQRARDVAMPNATQQVSQIIIEYLKK